MKAERDLTIRHDYAQVRNVHLRELKHFIDAPYREVRISDSAHWVQNEAVDEVNAALLEFLDDDLVTSKSV